MEKFKFDKDTDNLFKAILRLGTVKEAESFFRDLCTIEEIRAMNERWKIARMLNKGETYREIAKKLNTSTTTIGRVALWVSNGEGGYKSALDNSNHHKKSLQGRG